jgi:hypothetical protein
MGTLLIAVKDADRNPKSNHLLLTDAACCWLLPPAAEMLRCSKSKTRQQHHAVSRAYYAVTSYSCAILFAICNSRSNKAATQHETADSQRNKNAEQFA